MPPLTVNHIEDRLADASPSLLLNLLRPRRAAVALVLRDSGASAEVLLMRRARHPGDPWSGQVSLPGGRQEPTDLDLVHTARRETLEEVGLDLAGGARHIGRLAEQLATPKITLPPLVVSPVLFALTAPEPPPLVLSEEAARAFWVPLNALHSGSCSGTHPWLWNGITVAMPCWNWDGEIIWGLTHRILESLFSAVGATTKRP